MRVGNTYPNDWNYPYDAGSVGVNPLCYYYAGYAPGGSFGITCNAPVFGRYLSIQQVSPYAGVMTLCEVQVYGATTAA